MLDPKMNNFPKFGHNRNFLKKSKTITFTHFCYMVLKILHSVQTQKLFFKRKLTVDSLARVTIILFLFLLVS